MFSGSRKVTYERTLSLPVDPNVPKSFSSQLIGGDSSDSSSDADFHVEELPQTVVENGLLSPAALDPGDYLKFSQLKLSKLVFLIHYRQHPAVK